MIALTSNPVDWVLAFVLGVPVLSVSVVYLAVWAADHADRPPENQR